MPVECLLPAAAAAAVTSLSTGGAELFSGGHRCPKGGQAQADEDGEPDEEQPARRAADRAIHIELTSVSGGKEAVQAPHKARQVPRVLGHGARVFLFERRAQRFLSVAELNAAAACVLTAKPVSLFVCHATGSATAAGAAAGSKGARCQSEGGEESDERPGVFAFEHEGVPAFQKFIAIHRHWRMGLGAFGRAALQCDGDRVGRQSQFLWHADGTVQHVGSGLWLNVDRNNPVEVVLGEMAASFWTALPAT